MCFSKESSVVESFFLWHTFHQNIFQSRVISSLGIYENVFLALIDNTHTHTHTHTSFSSLSKKASTFSTQKLLSPQKIKHILASFSFQGCVVISKGVI